MSGDPVRLGLWPYLVGCHQIKVTGVCWVELHDMVHGLPIGHRHHPPAHHLHALIQVDLGWGGQQGFRGTLVHHDRAHGEGHAPAGGDSTQAWGLSLILFPAFPGGKSRTCEGELWVRPQHACLCWAPTRNSLPE